MQAEFEFKIELLNPAIHRREAFDCGVSALNEFLQKRARKEMAARASACFVLVPGADRGRIAGYYTLSQTSVELARPPEDLVRKLPRYPSLGATLIGRLARDVAFRGQHIGGLLLIDALRRSLRHCDEVGAVVVVTDPKDDKARAFYARYGFQPLDERRLFMPMRDLMAREAEGWAAH
jgi:predicted GNAT family N-acyltransferase